MNQKKVIVSLDYGSFLNRHHPHFPGRVIVFPLLPPILLYLESQCSLLWYVCDTLLWIITHPLLCISSGLHLEWLSGWIHGRTLFDIVATTSYRSLFLALSIIYEVTIPGFDIVGSCGSAKVTRHRCYPTGCLPNLVGKCRTRSSTCIYPALSHMYSSIKRWSNVRPPAIVGDCAIRRRLWPFHAFASDYRPKSNLLTSVSNNMGARLSL